MPFTGCRAAAVTLCHRQHVANTLLERAEVPVPPFALARRNRLPGGLRYPVIVKPSGEDASVGIDGGAVCEGPQALEARLATMGEHFSELLVQEYVAGRELNVGFLGSEALTLSEISFAKMPPGAWPIVSYAAKWAEGSPEYLGTEPVCPAVVDEAQAKAILTVARRAWQVLGGEGYGRVDMAEEKHPSEKTHNGQDSPQRLDPPTCFERHTSSKGLLWEGEFSCEFFANVENTREKVKYSQGESALVSRKT